MVCRFNSLGGFHLYDALREVLLPKQLHRQTLCWSFPITSQFMVSDVLTGTHLPEFANSFYALDT